MRKVESQRVLHWFMGYGRKKNVERREVGGWAYLGSL